MSAHQFAPRIAPVDEIASQSASASASFGLGDLFGWGAPEPVQVAKPMFGGLAERMRAALPPELRAELDADDAFQAELAKDGSRDPNRDGYRRSAARIGRGYADDAPAFDGTRSAGMGSRDERLAVLDRLTQNAEEGGEGAAGENRCGATTLLAGAVLGGGTAGVQALVTQLQADEAQRRAGDPRQKADPVLAMVSGKLAKGEALTDNDLRVVQESLHGLLRRRDEGRRPEGELGVSDTAIKEVLGDNPALQKMFADSGLSVMHVDNDGDDRADHFALHDGAAGSADEAVYDPLARRDGHQVVTAPGRVHDYDLAKKNEFR